MQKLWMLVVTILVTGAAAVSEDHIYEDGKVKRQEFDLTTRLGPNNEVILLCDGREIVYLTGNNARVVNIAAGEMVTFTDDGVVTISSGRIGPFQRIFQFTSKTCGFTPGSVGPGKLYLSDRQAFYTNDECQEQVINVINGFIASAPSFSVDFKVTSTMESGRNVLRLIVNEDEFMLVLTGAIAKRIDATQSVMYSGSILTVQGVELSDSINNFFVIRRPPSSSVVETINYNGTTPVNIQGPGQLYVSVNSAIYIEDFSFSSGSTNQAETINNRIFMQTFIIQRSGSNVLVMDILNNPIATLTSRTSTLKLPDAVSVRYSGTGSQGTVSFVSTGGRVINIKGVQAFSVYDNNELRTFLPPVDRTINLSAGGTVFVDPVQKTVLFSSDSNSVVASQISSAIPAAERVLYTTETNSDNVYLLLAINSSSAVTEIIQTLTGSFVIEVQRLQKVTYSDNEIVIEDAFGNVVTRIGQVNQLVTNTGITTSGTFNMSSIVPFLGPGTLSYSRGTAFFTTDRALGRDIAFASATAPIPDIDFERVPAGFNIVDGVNYTVYTVIQRIGGDRVITYEATSYTTASDQEILYSGDLVTVIRPIRTREGTVIYSGSEQTVTYTDRTGTMVTIEGVDTFYDFSGGDVRTTTSPDSITLRGPGKLYFVSDDRSDVLFSTSNIVTSRVAGIIRQGVIEFSVSADQFSSIFTGVFNFSTNSATVTYPGGGVIWYSTIDGIRESLYVLDDGVSNQIRRTVSTLLTLTKSAPAKNLAIIRTIFNGFNIYSYSPVSGNRDILISKTGSFIFNGTALVGVNLAGGPYTGISRVITFDGIEVKEFNSSVAPKEFDGFGLLLVQFDFDTAFYTTSVPAINFLLQAIANLQEFLVPPQIRPGTGRITTKNRTVSVYMGTDVTVFDGASVTFLCNVREGRPDSVIRFFKIVSGQPVMPLNNTVEGVQIVNNSLTLLGVDMGDAAVYTCTADNGVPPAAEASSTLRVRAAVAPQLQPGWFPFYIRSGQKIIWPTVSGAVETVDIRVVSELVVPCRVDGKPKAAVQYTFNDFPIETRGLNVSVVEVFPGRWVLRIFPNLEELIVITQPTHPLLGTNVIECIADNNAGSAIGRLTLNGEIVDCEAFTDMSIPCSRTCGFGLRDRRFECFRYTSDTTSEMISIDAVSTAVVPLIDRREPCTNSLPNGDVIICPITEYRWNASEWSDCSRTCGGGIRNRTVTCLNISIPVNTTYAARLGAIVETEAEDNMCIMFEAAGAKPTERELCNKEDCPFWQASQFSECSVTCGGGVRQRTVSCVSITGRYKDMNGKKQFNITTLEDMACNEDTRPEASRACNNHKCFFVWRAGRQYGDCGDLTLPSGVGVDEFKYCRRRSVDCRNEANAVVSNSFCDDQPRPTSLASCGGGRCFVGIWSELFWTECSVTCGYGTQTRDFYCFSPDTLIRVSNDFCDTAIRPLARRQCFARNCDNICLRDEDRRRCPMLAARRMCGSAFAMGNNGLRCCVSCMGMAGGD